MKLTDLCVCNKSMRRGAGVVKLLACGHLIHAKCLEFEGLPRDGFPCPYCGVLIEGRTEVQRRTYRKHPNADRRRIIDAIVKGEDWVALARVLSVPLTTAEEWARRGVSAPQSRGGNKPRILNPQHVQMLVAFLEVDPQLTLLQLRHKLQQHGSLLVSEATISRALHGMAITVKRVHPEPGMMNDIGNKRKRQQYVAALLRFVAQGTQEPFVDVVITRKRNLCFPLQINSSSSWMNRISICFVAGVVADRRGARGRWPRCLRPREQIFT